MRDDWLWVLILDQIAALLNLIIILDLGSTL